MNDLVKHLIEYHTNQMHNERAGMDSNYRTVYEAANEHAKAVLYLRCGTLRQYVDLGLIPGPMRSMVWDLITKIERGENDDDRSVSPTYHIPVVTKFYIFRNSLLHEYWILGKDGHWSITLADNIMDAIMKGEESNTIQSFASVKLAKEYMESMLTLRGDEKIISSDMSTLV